MISKAFTVMFGFVAVIFERFGLWVLAKWNMRVAAVMFYITATATALGVLYLGVGALLGNLCSSLPPGSIFYGFAYMIITPNIPICITSVASAWVLLRAYQWFRFQAQIFSNLASVGF